jgi:uncharacterized membrane protein
MGWYGHGLGWAVFLFMGLACAALIGLVIWLIVRSLPAINSPLRSGGTESAGDILDKRFARGDIDETTYTAQRPALSAAPGSRR